MSSHLFSLPTAVDVPDEELYALVPPIEAVLFDFANTLFRMVSTEIFLLRVWRAAGLPLAELDIESVENQIRAAAALPHVIAAQAGRDSSEEQHREATRAWFDEVPALAGIFEVAYDAVCAQENWYAYNDTAPVLRELAERGVPVGVVSDICWDVRRDFEAAGLGDTVGAYALSYQLGYEKPDPRMFLKTCADLGADPRRTLMVGDNPMRDGGATACGLRVLLLPSEPRDGERGLRSVLRLLG